MTGRPTLKLVCNSHIDPVWLWPWEEGIAAAVSTFRTAAELCEEFDGFVFCHNEALLYRWVEDYEPALFERIRLLVGAGRWHVMGGWYLQPDCNLPSGESFVRQVLAGRTYFLEAFGVEPRVAVNVDPFGHTRGLVQILKKSGYTGYLFCRPDAKHLDLPSDDFLWVGYDGSTVIGHRAADHYNSELGKASAKAERWMTTHADRQDGLLLWGVGNHGGGPSRTDLSALRDLMRDTSDRSIVHSTPEAYFDALASRTDELPRVKQDLNPWAPGCYTSMSTVKRAHRRLESRFYLTEKMAASAAVQGLLPYPRLALATAQEDLLFSEFHDILPGSSVSEVEIQALQRLAHGMEIVDRVRARSFFALLSGQPVAGDGEYPVFVHNPHPFAVTGTVVCEFQPPEPNFNSAVFWEPELTAPDGTRVLMQLEKESCNIQTDQRKRIVFQAHLPSSITTRYACRIREVARRSSGDVRGVTGTYSHQGEDCEACVDGESGLLTSFRVGGLEYLAGGAFAGLIMKDSADPWGMKVRSFRDRIGAFHLLSAADTARLAGVTARELAPVRVIEDGPVRTVVEAALGYRRSTLLVRYTLPRVGTEIGIEARVNWCEQDAMLKLALPTALANMRVAGQAAFGVERHTREAEELIWQQWLACLTPDESRALTVINDGVYGFDWSASEIRLSCLRSPAHAGHPVDDVTPVVRQDRIEPRVDQGEHVFRFWLNAGPASSRLSAIDREATTKHEVPMALVAFPSGDGRPPVPGVIIDDDVVQMPAMKLAEDGSALIVRLFEPTGHARTTNLRVPHLDVVAQVELGAFEVRTLRIDFGTRALCNVDLVERPVAR